MQDMIHVSLDDLTQCALIVPAKTGIFYENQSSGAQCARPSQEGYLLPIAHDAPLDQPELALESRVGSLFPQGNPGVIDKQLASKLEDILASSVFTRGISVDWSMLQASTESWVHVIVDHIGTLGQGHQRFTAILTWPNSD
ncbi:DUF6210 family protein [Lysobacter brunescens]|uniref:DUF6210 family protein n=1 Tax=Lysobacter brunescens TaxID=262323 RepID=A0ABW2YBP6_9GAMM